MFERLCYLDEAGTMIGAFRKDGSVRVIEPTSPLEWSRAKGGKYGEVLPHDTAFGAGETIAPPPASPTTVGTAQFGIALINAGSLIIAESAIAASPEAQMIWEKSPSVSNSGAFRSALQVSMTDTAIDALFAAASTIIL